jgi:hypothetical protein
MRGNPHVRFGGRAEETDLPEGGHRASARSNRANATALVAEGVDLKTAQARLGHSNPRLTLGLYAQATEAADRAAADRLGVWFLGDDDQADGETRGMDAGSPRDLEASRPSVGPVTRVGAEGLEPPTSAL